MVLVGARASLPAEPVVHTVVARHAALHPDRIALTCGLDVRWSYRRLNARANQLAHYLRARQIGRGSIVGVCIDRTPELMVAILGILKAGASYVPLDPTYPDQRLKLMTSQLPRIELVAVMPPTRELIAGPASLDLSEIAGQLDDQPATDPQAGTVGADLCYVVFTSGSTGTPKAVAINHRGWYNLLNWLKVEYHLGPQAGSLALSSFGFDISQRGLMAPLFTGAPVHLLPSRHFDASLAYRLIGGLDARTLHCAPSTLYLLVERELATGGDMLHGISHVFIGGEPMSAGRVAEWARRPGNNVALLHQYGVAECTDVASSHLMVDYEAYGRAPLPAGRPVYNTEIQLLDENLREVPDGQTGEICITGTSVGDGYLNATPADAQRFVTIERDGAAVRLYRTGDRGYATPDSELIVVGRVDAQVKIRGMRIDLGDIEVAMRRHPRVRDVAVLALRDASGETGLIAAVLPAGGPIEMRGLRRDLLATLPRNMVPQQVVEVGEFPLNPNGKIDRLALARVLRPGGQPPGHGHQAQPAEPQATQISVD